LIIPLQDEERSVEALIRSIDAQSLSPDEVVLVDAGSKDETVRRAQAVPTRAPTRIVRAGRVHPGVARNIGVAASEREWLAFTDGGVVLERGWLAELAAAVTGGTAVVYGHYEPICDTFFKQCAAMAYVPETGPEGARGPSVASCLVRRSAFEAVGGFPPYLGVARLYGFLGLTLGIAALLGLGWWASLLLPGFFIGRAVKAAWVKRRSFGFRTLRASRVAGAAAVLVIVDAATLSGCFRWLFSGPEGRRPAQR
jgi:glycosyltransferase involved in cell wall biosynthesis